jgi:hypothetical protein
MERMAQEGNSEERFIAYFWGVLSDYSQQIFTPEEHENDVDTIIRNFITGFSSINSTILVFEKARQKWLDILWNLYNVNRFIPQRSQ